MRKWILVFSICMLQMTVFAQTAKNVSAPPGLSSIRIEDLKKDVYDLSDAHFRGRSA